MVQDVIFHVVQHFLYAKKIRFLVFDKGGVGVTHRMYWGIIGVPSTRKKKAMSNLLERLHNYIYKSPSTPHPHPTFRNC